MIMTSLNHQDFYFKMNDQIWKGSTTTILIKILCLQKITFYKILTYIERSLGIVYPLREFPALPNCVHLGLQDLSWEELLMRNSIKNTFSFICVCRERERNSAFTAALVSSQVFIFIALFQFFQNVIKCTILLLYEIHFIFVVNAQKTLTLLSKNRPLEDCDGYVHG